MSLKLPPALKKHTGRVLAVLDAGSGAAISSPGLSVWGTHTLALTDAPGVLLHDTGGLGAELTRKVEPIAEADLVLRLEAKGEKLVGRADLGSGLVVEFTTQREIAAIVAGILASRRALDGALFDSILAVDVEAWPVSSAPTPDSSKDLESTGASEHSLRVVVIADRLKLLREGETIADLPARFLEYRRPESRQIVVTTRTTLADQIVARFTIHFPVAAMARDLEKVLVSASRTGQGSPAQASSVTPPHVTSVVHIRGRVAGPQSADTDVDLLLGERWLELREMASGQILCRFDLDDSGPASVATRVVGTNQEFLLCDAVHGPVQVSGGAESLRQSLTQHARIQALAQRSLQSSPFLLYVDSRPAALSIGQGSLIVAGQGVDRSIPIDTLVSARCGLRDGETCLAIRGKDVALEVWGQREVLESLHAALLLELIEQGSESAETIAKAILGLEGDYLAYAIFGRFLELDDLLRRKSPGSGARIALPASGTPEPLLELSALMIQGTGSLIRHLHMVQSYLPVSLAERDGALCAGLGADAPDFLIRKQQERDLRRALAPVAGLRVELEKIHNLLLSRTGLDAVALAAQDDYGGLAISLVGAVINPIFLLGSAQQLYSSYQRGTQGETSRKEGARVGLGYAFERWSELLSETVPLLSYHTLEDVFPSRLQLVKSVLGAAEKHPETAVTLRRRLSRRRATLEARLAHRSEGATASRHEIALRLRAARDRIRYPDLQLY